MPRDLRLYDGLAGTIDRRATDGRFLYRDTTGSILGVADSLDEAIEELFDFYALARLIQLALAVAS